MFLPPREFALANSRLDINPQPAGRARLTHYSQSLLRCPITSCKATGSSQSISIMPHSCSAPPVTAGQSQPSRIWQHEPALASSDRGAAPRRTAPWIALGPGHPQPYSQWVENQHRQDIQKFAHQHHSPRRGVACQPAGSTSHGRVARRSLGHRFLQETRREWPYLITRQTDRQIAPDA
jgi:hypothetical protein